MKRKKERDCKQKDLIAADVICPRGRRRARAKQGGMRKPKTHVLASASSTRDWRPAIQVAFPQRRRTDQKLVFDATSERHCHMELFSMRRNSL